MQVALHGATTTSVQRQVPAGGAGRPRRRPSV